MVSAAEPVSTVAPVLVVRQDLVDGMAIHHVRPAEFTKCMATENEENVWIGRHDAIPDVLSASAAENPSVTAAAKEPVRADDGLVIGMGLEHAVGPLDDLDGRTELDVNDDEIDPTSREGLKVVVVLVGKVPAVPGLGKVARKREVQIEQSGWLVVVTRHHPIGNDAG